MLKLYTKIFDAFMMLLVVFGVLDAYIAAVNADWAAYWVVMVYIALAIPIIRVSRWALTGKKERTRG